MQRISAGAPAQASQSRNVGEKDKRSDDHVLPPVKKAKNDGAVQGEPKETAAVNQSKKRSYEATEETPNSNMHKARRLDTSSSSGSDQQAGENNTDHSREASVEDDPIDVQPASSRQWYQMIQNRLNDPLIQRLSRRVQDDLGQLQLNDSSS